jgi:hypothetical protein
MYLIGTVFILVSFHILVNLLQPLAGMLSTVTSALRLDLQIGIVHKGGRLEVN